MASISYLFVLKVDATLGAFSATRVEIIYLNLASSFLPVLCLSRSSEPTEDLKLIKLSQEISPVNSDLTCSVNTSSDFASIGKLNL